MKTTKGLGVPLTINGEFINSLEDTKAPLTVKNGELIFDGIYMVDPGWGPSFKGYRFETQIPLKTAKSIDIDLKQMSYSPVEIRVNGEQIEIKETLTDQRV